jgi:hypothetical protein
MAARRDRCLWLGRVARMPGSRFGRAPRDGGRHRREVPRGGLAGVAALVERAGKAGLAPDPNCRVERGDHKGAGVGDGVAAVAAFALL